MAPMLDVLPMQGSGLHLVICSALHREAQDCVRTWREILVHD